MDSRKRDILPNGNTRKIIHIRGILAQQLQPYDPKLFLEFKNLNQSHFLTGALGACAGLGAGFAGVSCGALV